MTPTKYGQPFRVDAKALALAHVTNGKVLAIRPDFFGSPIALPLAIVANRKLDIALMSEEIAPTAEAHGELKARASARSSSGEEPGDSSQVAIVQIDGPLAQRAEEHMCGSIDGYDAIAARFADANNDPAVGAIIMRICSPGGDAAGTEEAVRRMRKMADASGKFVVAFADEQAASAAYWIAAGVADEVMVPPLGEVGSIGCIGGWVDATKAYEAEGFQWHIVRDPPGKAAGHAGAPLAELADARATSAIAEIAGRFIDAMAARRDAAGGKRGIRALDGDMLRGKAAVDGGLANRVGSFEDALKLAADAANRRRINMNKAAKETKALLALGLTEESTDEQIAAAAADATLGKSVKTVTGQTDASAALGTVQAWQVSHQRSAADRAEAETQRKAQDERDRDALVVRLVTDCGEHPATAWANVEEASDQSKRKPAEPWASMPVAQLRARVDTLAKMPKQAAPKPVQTDGATISEREIAECKSRGVDPEKFAATKAAVLKNRTTQALRAV